jgi:hypothetical protein
MSEQPNNRDDRDDQIYKIVSLVTKVRAAKEILRGTGSEESIESQVLQMVMFSLTKLDEILSDRYEELY